MPTSTSVLGSRGRDDGGDGLVVCWYEYPRLWCQTRRFQVQPELDEDDRL